VKCHYSDPSRWGPRGQESPCQEEGDFIVHWPGDTFHACAYHAAGWAQIAVAMGLKLRIDMASGELKDVLSIHTLGGPGEAIVIDMGGKPTDGN